MMCLFANIWCNKHVHSVKIKKKTCYLFFTTVTTLYVTNNLCGYENTLKTEVPSSVAQLNKQPVRFLRAVLRFPGYCPLGTKDELIIRVGLLKGGQIQTAFSRERMELVKRISRNIYKLLAQEKETKPYILKSRTFGSDGAVFSTRDKCGLKRVVHDDKLEVQGTIGDILDRLEQGLLKLENAAVEKIGKCFSGKTRKEMSPTPSKGGSTRRAGKKQSQAESQPGKNKNQRNWKKAGWQKSENL